MINISLYLISILEPGLEGSYPKDGVTDVRWLSEQLINQKRDGRGVSCRENYVYEWGSN